MTIHDTPDAVPTAFPERLSRHDRSANPLATPGGRDPALLAAIRIIESAAIPMALMIGGEGHLVPNEPMLALFENRLGADPASRTIFALLPEKEALFRNSLERGLAGEASALPSQPIALGPTAMGKTGWFNFDFVPVGAMAGHAPAVLVIATDVTAHVLRARDLSDAVGRLRLALEGSGMVGIWTKDASTNISSCDANVARMFGLPPGDCERGVEDDLFIGAIHPDDRKRVLETLRSAIENGEPYRARYRIETPGKPQRWAIASGKPAFGADGTLERLLGVIVDITDQMETAAALAESRFQFETLTEALPQIVWSSDAQGRHDYFSARWSEFTGILPEDITEESWKRLVHPDDWPMVSREWGDAMREGKPYDIDYRFLHHSGDYRWLRVMALPIRNENGDITRWSGTSTDIHDAYLLAEEREALGREIERIATEDQLTGVLTRRAFVERAAAAIDEMRQAGRPASLLMIDIDHFKSVNDTHGHMGGDRVLSAAALRMKTTLKEGDLIGRLGGEEFAILLSGSASQDACDIAERVRRAVEIEPIPINDASSLPITVSIGVATDMAGRQGLEWMLGLADKALYQAKAAGRNRSMFIGEDAGIH